MIFPSETSKGYGVFQPSFLTPEALCEGFYTTEAKKTGLRLMNPQEWFSKKKKWKTWSADDFPILHDWLAVWTPLKKISQLGWFITNIWKNKTWKIKHVQTTNQMISIPLKPTFFNGKCLTTFHVSTIEMFCSPPTPSCTWRGVRRDLAGVCGYPLVFKHGYWKWPQK